MYAPANNDADNTAYGAKYELRHHTAAELGAQPPTNSAEDGHADKDTESLHRNFSCLCEMKRVVSVSHTGGLIQEILCRKLGGVNAELYGAPATTQHLHCGAFNTRNPLRGRRDMYILQALLITR